MGEVALPGIRELVREREFRVLVLAQVVFFVRPLFLETFFFRDLHLFTYFQRLKTASLLAGGELPLWDPFLHGGQPLLAVLTNTALYPANLLYVAFPGVVALNLEIVAHLALAGAAAYAAARVLRLSPAAGLVAALAFELCGYQLSLANHLNRLVAMPWAALSFLFWARFLEERKARWLAATSAAGGLMALAGFPELFLLQPLFLAGWSLGAAAGRRQRLQALGGLAAAWLLAAGMAAVQLVPAALHSRGSSRSTGGAPPGLLEWSVPPQELPELVVPGFFGRVDTLPDEDYWGGRRQDQGFPYILSLYFGVPVLLLAVAGAAAPAGRTPLSRGARTALAAAAAVSLLLSLGRFLPGFPAVARAAAELLPLRYPVKFLAAGLLPLALLAGAGAGGLLREVEDRWSRRTFRASLATAAVLAVIPAALAALPEFDRVTESLFFGIEPAEAVRVGLLGAFLHAAIAAVLFAFLCCRSRLSAAFRGWALAALVAADLLSAGAPAMPLAPRTLLAGEPPLAGLVRSVAADGKLFRDDDPKPLHLSAPSPDIYWLARWNLDSLSKYTASGFRIPVVFHIDFDGLGAREVVSMSEAVRRLPWESRLGFLSAAGVRAVLRERGRPVPGLQPVAEFPVSGDRALVLERNPAALPPAAIVTAWLRADTLPEAIAAMRAPGFDPGRLAVVAGESRAPVSPCDYALRGSVGEGTPETLYEVQTGCRALLVRTTPFQPGWRATVDGSERPVVRANGIFQGVLVEKGEHRVRFAYRPPGLLAGGLVSLLSLVVIGALTRYPRAT
jgi:hypothetical protein